MIKLFAPDILIMGLGLPAMLDTQLVLSIKECRKATRILILSNGTNSEDIRAFRLSGVEGFVSKDRSSTVIVEAVRAVAAGEGRWHLIPKECPFSVLTRRESLVLGELTHGHSNAEIASALVISDHTVRNHLSSIYAKLGLASAREAIVLALNEGLTARCR